MFRAASDDDIEAYSDTVTCFIRKCIDDVVPTKTIRIYPNQKPWINSDVRSALSARTSAFKSGNTDDRKQASYDLRRSISGFNKDSAIFHLHSKDYVVLFFHIITLLNVFIYFYLNTTDRPA